MKTTIVRLLAAATLLLMATAAWATHIDVAASGGVGVVVVADDGQCSLREAMLLANNAKANNDCVPVADGNINRGTINLPTSATFTLTDGPYDADGPNGLPDVGYGFIIQGHGATITRSTAVGTPRFRLLHVSAFGLLEINDVTFSHGYTPDGSGEVDGVGNDGGDGGGIYNAGTLSLIGSTVSVGTTGAGAVGASTDGSGGAGGGIYNVGTLNLTDSILNANTAGAGVAGGSAGEAGAGGNGGGVVNAHGVLTISGSTISNNSTGLGGNGGGIYNAGTLTISTSSLHGNTTIGDGGGLITTDGSVAISTSTLSNNSARSGGGLVVLGSEVSVSNSTLAGNTATATQSSQSLPPCGAIYALGNGAVALSYSTVSGHSGYDICIFHFPNIWNIQLTLDHTIIDGSGASDACLSGGIVSKGYNMASDASCGLNATGDLPNTDPLLAALADNGGPTRTMLPWFDGPSVDAVPVADCALGVPTGVDVSTDQRGLPRPSGYACDIGAVEGQQTPSVLNALGGYDQHTIAGDPFEYPLVVQVLDALGRPVKHLPILLGEPSSGASAVCLAASTDSTGIARVYCTANGVAGSYSVTLGAGNAGLSAAFTLTNEANDRIFGSGFEGSALPTVVLSAGQSVADMAVTVPSSLLAGRIVPILAVKDHRGHRVALVEARRDADGIKLRTLSYDAHGLPQTIGAWQSAPNPDLKLHIGRRHGVLSASLAQRMP